MKHTLLVELLTEELPPKALSKLGDAFASAMLSGLSTRAFVEEGATCTAHATPRRLAVTISGVRASSPDKQIREKVLPVTVALDKDGKPAAPLVKKLAALATTAGRDSISPEELERASDGKAESFFFTYTAPGQPLAAGLHFASHFGKLCCAVFRTFHRALCAAQFQLGDGTLGACLGSIQVRQHGTQFGLSLFELQCLIARHITRLGQLGNVLLLLGLLLCLQGAAFQLQLQAGEQRFLSGDGFINGRQLAVEGHFAGFKQTGLREDVLADHRIAAGRHQIAMKADRRTALDFCHQPTFGSALRHVVLADRFEIGFGGVVVQLDQRLAGFHALAFTDCDTFYDTPGHVLYGFAFRVDCHGRLRGHAFIQRRGCRPCEETAEPDHQRHKAQAYRVAGIGGQIRRQINDVRCIADRLLRQFE